MKRKGKEEERRNNRFVPVPRKKRSVVIYGDIEYRNDENPPNPAPLPPPPPSPPQWLLGMMRYLYISDNDPKHIIDKTLDNDDVDPRLNRLSIPFNNLIRNDFLNPDESRINGDNSDGKMCVAVILVDQRAKNWNVSLKSTRSKSGIDDYNWSYELSGEWNDVVKARGMKSGDNVSLWSFRCPKTGILYFAIVPPPISL